MMPSSRLDRRLPEILDEIAQPRKPDYFDDLVGLSARTRQRPAWTLLERWLPMVDIARQPVIARQVPWRPIAVLLSLLLLIAASLVWVAGSRHPLPAPFGPARNGLVVYAKDGDIFTANPATGDSTAIVKGFETDINPTWSREGTHMAFERIAASGAGSGDVYVALPDGSGMTRVTPETLVGITAYAFSPDGTQLLISARSKGVPSLFLAATDGSGIHQLEVGMPATNAAWRPPDGAQISFMDSDNGDPNSGNGAIHLVSSQGGDVRTIVSDQRPRGINRGHPLWSPDGSHMVYGEWCDNDCATGEPLAANIGNTVQTFIVGADGKGAHALADPAGDWQAPESWSNDGSKVLVIRGPELDGTGDAQPVAIAVDGSAQGVEIPYPGGIGTDPTEAWQWAPDDSSILGTPSSASGAAIDALLLDPVHGTFRTPPWRSVTEASWQRIAQ
jgi:Tol biopolymer transport system component